MRECLTSESTKAVGDPIWIGTGHMSGDDMSGGLLSHQVGRFADESRPKLLRHARMGNFDDEIDGWPGNSPSVSTESKSTLAEIQRRLTRRARLPSNARAGGQALFQVIAGWFGSRLPPLESPCRRPDGRRGIGLKWNGLGDFLQRRRFHRSPRWPKPRMTTFLGDCESCKREMRFVDRIQILGRFGMSRSLPSKSSRRGN